MTDESNQNDTPVPEATPSQPASDAPIGDLLQGFNMVPTWAKQESGGVSFDDRRDSKRRPGQERSGRTSPGRHDASKRKGEGRRGPPRDGRPGSGGKRPDQRHGQSQGGHSYREDRGRPAPRPMLPVDISFIPERDQLGAVVRQMIAWKRAAPLHDLANLFLAKPELYLLKIEPRSAKAKGGGDGPGTPENPVIFYQTTGDRHLFLQREEAVQHVMGDLLDKVFTVEDVVTEPPAGNFVCVGRCRRTGTLIGPPNYHAFQEGLLQLQQSHFPNLSIDAVRGFIEMVREPEVIEQWRESFRHQKVYKRKDAGEGEAEKTYTRDEACEVIVQQHLAGAIREGNRAILPAVAAPAVTDERLRNTIYAATARERRFPLTMMLALRPAFKRMKLHLFKAGKGETYVTAIPPKPLDADHAIDSIRQMHELLVEHPGWSRKQLAQKIMPDEPLDSEKVVAFLKPLTWLIDKGHVIEFHNGALALPGSHRIDVQSMKTGEPVKGSLPPDEATVATPTAAIAEPATDEPLAAPEPVDEPPAPEVAPRKVGQGDAPTDAEAISSSSPEPNEPTKPDSPAPDEPAS